MANTKEYKTRWQRIRKLFNDIHLWFGLSSGLIVIAVCFSGTLYVFNTEISEKGAPHLYQVKSVGEKIAVDSLMQIVSQKTEGTITSVQIPASDKRTFQFGVKTAADTTARSGTTYMVNPYTGEITGNSKEKNKAKEFMSTMFSLHRWLLLDKIETPILKEKTNRQLGSMITGWATIIFTLGCITGLVIWFPKKIRYWRQGLKVKWNAGWKRLNHDLHNTFAFYALIFLLLMGITGPQWSFDWYRTGLQKTLGTYKPRETRGNEEKKDNNKKEGQKKDTLGVEETKLAFLTIATIIQKADSVLPYTGNYNISLSAEDGKTMITKTKTGFFAPAAGDRITMNGFSGEIDKVDIFTNKPVNERIAGSIKAIHVGNVYGTFSKILYFLACLIATSLPITGTLIWLNKMKKKRKKSYKKMEEKPMIRQAEMENA